MYIAMVLLPHQHTSSSYDNKLNHGLLILSLFRIKLFCQTHDVRSILTSKTEILIQFNFKFLIQQLKWLPTYNKTRQADQLIYPVEGTNSTAVSDQISFDTEFTSKTINVILDIWHKFLDLGSVQWKASKHRLQHNKKCEHLTMSLKQCFPNFILWRNS